ncbi:transglycosylase domain-containing protein [Lederbergia graminis]|uniref:Transglycosylase domain-containing protein n=2 Tax=Lederbergia graminis TaxID=735518 RepID=A0ABW0LEW3_9BACI
MAGDYKTREERRKQSKPNKKTKTKAKSGKGQIIKKAFLIVFFIGILGLVVGGTMFAIYASDAPPIDEVLLTDPVASEVLDINGDVFAVLGAENRDYVSYDDIPKEVEDAVLAIEDVRFYEHSGIDLRRLAGAVLANVTRGFGAEGASTITQQIVKLSFLSEEKTLKRKAQEAWLALKLEQNYTKEQIFEIYVNKIYYGNGIYGIETAAQFYFGKELNELELHERAFLAGVPQRPNGYDPYVYPENAEKRKDLVLTLMEMHGKISEEEMKAAQDIHVTETLIPEEDNVGKPYKYDSFVGQVIKEVEALGDYNVYADGLKIHTTLDPKAQEYTEKMLLTDEIVQFPNDEMQAGLVLLDTKTGEIRAIGGNRFKDIKRGRNYATQLSDRQPGSTIKPILDYGPAIEYLNWSTYEQIVDEPYKYSDGTKINNWDNKHYGQMTIRQALYQSRNIPALKAFQAVGSEKAKEFAANLGLPFDEVFESASIGGIENVSPMKLAGAYATFGNNGMYNQPHTVKKIVFQDGETEVVNKVTSKVAIKDSTAYMVTDMLKDVLSNKAGSTGKRAIIPGLPAAGKTGTTNYSDEEYEKYDLNRNESPVPDAWFAGYTTNYTIAVWTGYDKRSTPIPYKDQRIAMDLYKNLMSYISKDIETPDFKMPKSVVEVAVEKGTNPAKKPSKYTPKSNIVYELFVNGTQPTEESTIFDKLEAPSVSGEYNESNYQVSFTWNHPEQEEKELQFEVTLKTSDGGEQSLGTTTDTTLTIEHAEPGISYTLDVKAISKTQTSSSGTATVTVPEMEEEVPDDIPDNSENPNGNGNGNDNSNGNGNGNGNEGNQDGNTDGNNTPNPGEDNKDENTENPDENEEDVPTDTPPENGNENGNNENNRNNQN